MSFVVADRVQETCVSPGTGTVNLLGAVTGYKSFSSSIGANNTCYYVIADQYGTNWEVGIGTIGSGGITLVRTTVLASSNGGSLVAFTSGTQNVWVDYPATKVVTQDLIYAPSSFQGTFTDGIVMDYVTGNGRFSVGTADGFTWYNGGVGSTSLMTLLSNGNLGLGTASPSYKLSIAAAGNAFSLGSTTSSTAYNAALINNSGGSLYWGVDNNAGTAFNGSAYAGVIGTSNATNFQIFTNNVTRATIDSSGNLGIGTSSPQNKFVVSNAGAAGMEFVPSYTGLATGPAVYSYNRSGAAWTPQTYLATSHFWGAGSNPTLAIAMNLDTSGNLGLGVTPSGSSWTNAQIKRSQLSGGASDRTELSYNSTYNGGYYYIGSDYATLNTQIAGQHRWYNAPSGTAGNAITFTQAMTLDNSGNLLVGITTNVWGAKIVAASTGQICNFNTTSTTAAGVEIDVAANNTTQQALFVYSSGNTATNAIIYSNGNIVNRNNSYGAISDIKLKENIVDATPKLDDLLKVKVRNYNLIGEEIKQIGVIAQELEEVFPSMIDISPDVDKEGNALGTETKSVKYSVFVPMLIKSIQELSAKVTALEAQLGAK